MKTTGHINPAEFPLISLNYSATDQILINEKYQQIEEKPRIRNNIWRANKT